MIRAAAWLVGAVLAAHGIAHLVGFLVSWRLMSSPELPYKTTLAAGHIHVGAAGIRVVGLLWLTAAAAFVAGGVMFALGAAAAPMLVTMAIAGSLVLCVAEWPEARVGVYINIALLLALPAIGGLSWRHQSDRVWAEIGAAALQPHVATKRGHHGLPPVVARYLSRAVPDPLRRPQVVDLTQDAEFFVGDGWRPLRARQRFTAEPSAFVWDARIEMAPLVPIYVRDNYRGGQGAMRGEVLGLYPMLDQHGRAELSSAALHRYLAEAVWFPTALFPGPRVSWDAVSDRAARVTLTDGSESVWLEFRFDDAGDVVEIFTPQRYAEQKGNYVPQPWLVRCTEHREYDGFRIPVACTVEWQLPSGPLPYWRGRVTSVHYQY